MQNRTICIDLSNVVPGKGGTGGGISTYAINLVKNLDVLLNDSDLKVFCIKNNEFNGLGQLKNIEIRNVKVNNSNFFSRLLWLHVRLPLYCVKNKIKVLHRVVPELPLIKVCNYIITLHDFMFDFYLQNPPLKKYLVGSNLLKFKLFRKFTSMAVRIANGIIVPADTILAELGSKFPIQNKKVVTIYEASNFPGCDLKEKKKQIH